MINNNNNNSGLNKITPKINNKMGVAYLRADSTAEGSIKRIVR